MLTSEQHLELLEEIRRRCEAWIIIDPPLDSPEPDEEEERDAELEEEDDDAGEADPVSPAPGSPWPTR